MPRIIKETKTLEELRKKMVSFVAKKSGVKVDKLLMSKVQALVDKEN